jgi:hypothetical protein
MVVRWKFTDPTDSSTQTFEINPFEGGTPSREMNISTQNTLAPGGKTLVWEGAESPQTIEFSGTILSESQLELYNTWFSKKHQIQLTDDLNREYMILFRTYVPKRVHSANFWRHEFTVSAIIVDWP